MRAHTSHEFEEELQALSERLLAMGGRCERMIEMAAEALESRDPALAEEVIRLDRRTNADELEIDERAVRILALRQPVGRDLRFTITAIKVVTDLERIGDEAVNLAERAMELAGRPPIEAASKLPEMARRAQSMLHDALDSFVWEDATLARSVFARDDAVDALYGETLMRSMRLMQERPGQVEGGMKIASCAKYLERIADHATNLAEMVVFLVEGEDIRHGGRGGI
ncbi:MAG: phosphate signaling complex protein PhoU [Myxococcales bacterium]|nr:phosphate signaling complex protein PhoU [Myxococcales bacterium]